MTIDIEQLREAMTRHEPIACWSMDPSFQTQWHVAFYPNRFHRFMYRVLLGIYWRKL